MACQVATGGRGPRTQGVCTYRHSRSNSKLSIRRGSKSFQMDPPPLSLSVQITKKETERKNPKNKNDHHTKKKEGRRTDYLLFRFFSFFFFFFIFTFFHESSRFFFFFLRSLFLNLTYFSCRSTFQLGKQKKKKLKREGG